MRVKKFTFVFKHRTSRNFNAATISGYVPIFLKNNYLLSFTARYHMQ